MLEYSPRAEGFQPKLAKKAEGTVKMIKGDNGDVIDCVDIYKQPGFNHPLSKNYPVQMQPSSQKFGEHTNDPSKSKLAQEWRKNADCPNGSIPIKRPIITGHSTLRKNTSFANLEYSTAGHQYSVIDFSYGSPTIQGAAATISIWDPSLANYYGDFSLSQLWVVAGFGSSTNTLEAGWQVYPGRTGDSLPRLFIYWTADGYGTTGCYDLTCPGFIQTNQYFVIGGALPNSVYGGWRNELDIQIVKDLRSGNWWLYIGRIPIGYWPLYLFSGKSLGTSGADRISWGGEIFDSSGSNGFHTLTQMGSGHFAEEGLWPQLLPQGAIITDSSKIVEGDFISTMVARDAVLTTATQWHV
ncbi:hypothetical protein Ancab_029618, partial [Ancistrocladus abbreviatus]